MNTLDQLSPKNTEGSCTAEILGDPDFKTFTADQVTFVEDNVYKRWRITTQSSTADGHQELTAYIPFSESIANKEFNIVSNPNGPDQMSMVWVKRINGGIDQYFGIEGKAIVTLDTGAATLTASFDFNAERNPEHVHIKGKLSVKGLDHDTGSVTAEITGDAEARYKSTEVSLTHQPASRTFPPSFAGWSRHYTPRPDVRDLRISLSVADNLELGTYTVTEDSREVRVIFFDINNGLGYWATEGRVTLLKMPAENATTGELEARFEFKAKVTLVDGTEQTVCATDGHLHIKKQVVA